MVLLRNQKGKEKGKYFGRSWKFAIKCHDQYKRLSNNRLDILRDWKVDCFYTWKFLILRDRNNNVSKLNSFGVDKEL